ncbi:hypothetical protein TH0351_11370 [Helicobacter pylori]
MIKTARFITSPQKILIKHKPLKTQPSKPNIKHSKPNIKHSKPNIKHSKPNIKHSKPNIKH